MVIIIHIYHLFTVMQLLQQKGQPLQHIKIMAVQVPLKYFVNSTLYKGSSKNVTL